MKEPYPVVDRADGLQLWRSGITKLSRPSGICDGGGGREAGWRRKNGRVASLEVCVTGAENLEAGSFPANVFCCPRRCVPFK